jgi:GxxExxY protein
VQYEDITKKIIAAAMRVHSTLGNGFQEVIYQRAMEIEMPYEGLSFVREMEMPILSYPNEVRSLSYLDLKGRNTSTMDEVRRIIRNP